ncbi:MAG: hypothetical protein EXQ96_09795 [Alphaproteobacteria bacterium]|nr:hypothetical protein [Alphaproteobacteria bacterium]
MAPRQAGEQAGERGCGTGALARAFGVGRFVVTAEVAPPVTTDPETLLRRALPLRGLATAVNVTDSAGARAHLSSIVAGFLLSRHGIEPIVQMTCRDRNRLALQSDLLGALALGLGNVLILTGDDPRAGDQPDTKPVFDLDSRGLLALAERMRRERCLPTGTAIDGPSTCCWASPTLRSIRRPHGARTGCSPRSRREPISCRRNSAWIWT